MPIFIGNSYWLLLMAILMFIYVAFMTWHEENWKKIYAHIIRNQCFLNQNNDIRTFLKQHIIHIFYPPWSCFSSCRRPWPNRPELCILSKMLYRLLLPNLAEIPRLSPVISAWHVIWHYCYSMHHSKHCLFSRWTSWNEWGFEACSWYWKQGT